ncbi:hypothetical protein [Pseudoalteromonas luteoviolacea]|uniref:hypothetical protein n=1 Tax=Pseudoalteromonas luteoviolacea TaxID=43657 RepID=UPI001154AA26|nr:hypothetical protein [Pseudoalteromonas luteoviolacea]TQF70651.1 hypothetical protein FLM44_06045 [Pseudoalteromonas luteoviolacea]
MKYLVLASTLLLGACSSTYNLDQTMDLIAATEENAPNGVQGTFQFEIKAGDKIRGEVFLNTQEDYRDRRSITIALTPEVVKEFIRKEGLTPNVYFIGKKVEVTGEAKREKIAFFSRGKKTSKYYFQTHITVDSLDQIQEI